MPRFWWVNHKKTFNEEVGGGYLWSPKAEASGARSQYYDNLRIARPGDGVVSYSNGLIKALGMVADVAVAAPKPTEFGARGTQWADHGWLLPTAWRTLEVALKPKEFLVSLAPLLPMKYSPLQPATGNGNQKAYLSEISQEAFALVEQLAGALPTGEAAAVFSAPSSGDFLENFEAGIELRIRGSEEFLDTEKIQLVLARRGQGIFRRRVNSIENACRCTGIGAPELLVASHIKPWRCCVSGAERLDGNNGLLLSPNADHLFDRGLLSFADDGAVIVSSALSADNLRRLGLRTPNVGAFHPSQARYLEFHRSNVFVP